MAGPKRSQEAFEHGVRPSELERFRGDVDRQFRQARAVTREGRASWERDVDDGRMPSNRQVFRTTGGAAGLVRRNTHAFGQDGRVYMRQRGARTSYSDGALDADLLRFVRQMRDHMRFVVDPNGDEDV